MSFLIAAAGTGGHVFPGLAVGDALRSEGIPKEEILFTGGDRLEATVYPEHGYEFLQLELRGLKRSLSLSNLSLPRVVKRARDALVDVINTRGVSAVLGMGGYVTLPAAMAARATKAPLFLSEQNAVTGLANRISSRWATEVFMSFPHTDGLEGEWVGNPVRDEIASYSRDALHARALDRYGMNDDAPVVGVFGGSLGAASINEAISTMVANWAGPSIQVLHLVGQGHETAFQEVSAPPSVRWVRRGFEDRMDMFFAAIDLVVARAGGSVAEITATGTPSVLVPGEFGSSGHQSANAAFLAGEGAAVVVAQDELGNLGTTVRSLLEDGDRLDRMAGAARRISRPDAAKVIARAMIDVAS
jgi:UDP-N-acetylglucosamine--N-acetylmuramyl-(pentapeptide) pyrophosphoryl-undecaprenol N-acetylglucosamine transferase